MSFSDYVQKQAMAAVELPLVHTAEYFHLPSIQATNTLQTSDCKFFKEPLLYFFYGRPAYRDSTQILPTRWRGHWPQWPLLFSARSGCSWLALVELRMSTMSALDLEA
jgi:hypothetical protein